MKLSNCHQSAFDVLMAGARTAVSKRQQQCSKKRNLSQCSENHNNSDSLQTELELDKAFDNQKHDDQNCDGSTKKTMRLANLQDRITDMKSKIMPLRKTPVAFDPKVVACWGNGERLPFIFLSLVYEMISDESQTTVITNIACNMLRTVMHVGPDDLLATVCLSANRIAPRHEVDSDLGIGEHYIIQALAGLYGMKEAKIKNLAQKLGDLSLVAETVRASQSVIRKPQPLTVAKVFETLLKIAKESGKNSKDRKIRHIQKLLVAADGCEAKYLIRLLMQKTSFRIKFSEKTVLTALGQAAVHIENPTTVPDHVQSPFEEAVKIVKRAYSVCPDYDKIVTSLLHDGVWNLPRTRSFSVGIPFEPICVKATKSVSEIVKRFHNMEFTCEYKYDGERAQIHYMEGGTVEIFSRNLERSTGKYPDVVVAIPRLKKSSVKSFVLDCEIVAYDRENQKILPHQVLSTRARKNVDMDDIKVNVCIYAFDILYINGHPLFEEQLKVRRQHLYQSFEEDPGFFQFVSELTSSDTKEIQGFLDAAINASCEGLVIKTLSIDATYEPSERSNKWLKLKKDYMEGVCDSLDLVPIAAYHGSGKRTGVYGSFLLACYDNDNEEFQSICRTGTGFSDEMLEEISARFHCKIIPEAKPYYRYVANGMNPDVWFEPSEVWEVKAADLTISPVYCAAIGTVDPNKGLSLRFPRFIRIREDKHVDQASSSKQIAEMYCEQCENHPNH